MFKYIKQRRRDTELRRKGDRKKETEVSHCCVPIVIDSGKEKIEQTDRWINAVR